MNVLILGSGGREHVLAWKIGSSKLVDELYVAPGNAGTAAVATNVYLAVNDFQGISNFIIDKHINMLVVGPEEPLVNGLYDFLKCRPEHSELMFIGTDKRGAALEGSKDFAKSFMHRYGIPTARHLSVNSENVAAGEAFLTTLPPPYVLKADGLAAGKGVVIVDDLATAVHELHLMLSGKFGKASNTVLIEEFLKGIECSVFVLTDGDNYLVLPEAKDYKRIGEHDTGLNTGGMGAVSPVPFYTPDFAQKVESRIIVPTIKGLKAERMNYHGFLFFGLMNVAGDPFVVEYNVRMGDPETEVVIPRVKSDLAELLVKTAHGDLHNANIVIDNKACSTVMLVSGGYPVDYEKRKIINGVDNVKNALVFHAGTQRVDNQLITSGGRVMAITASGNDIFEAALNAYKQIKNIHFDKMYFRTDIASDLK